MIPKGVVQDLQAASVMEDVETLQQFLAVYKAEHGSDSGCSVCDLTICFFEYPRQHPPHFFSLNTALRECRNAAPFYCTKETTGNASGFLLTNMAPSYQHAWYHALEGRAMCGNWLVHSAQHLALCAATSDSIGAHRRQYGRSPLHAGRSACEARSDLLCGALLQLVHGGGSAGGCPRCR